MKKLVHSSQNAVTNHQKTQDKTEGYVCLLVCKTANNSLTAQKRDLKLGGGNGRPKTTKYY